MAEFIDLRSDTVTKPTPAMRQAMAEAEVGDDVFGEDPTVNALQEKVAALLGKEKALFVPSGTMANQLSIKAHTQPGDEVILEASAHPYNFEGGAGAMLSGVQFYCLPGVRGILEASQVEEAVRPLDHHFAVSRLVCLENTHNRGGGSIYPLKHIAAISKLAHSKGLLVHLDGARLWNASVATGLEPAQYAQWADSVSVCLSKGLGAPVGSLVAGSTAFIDARPSLPEDVRRRDAPGRNPGGRRDLCLGPPLGTIGGRPRERPATGSGSQRITGRFRQSGSRRNQHRHLRRYRQWHDSPPGGRVHEKKGVLIHAFGKTQIRLVTHLGISSEDVEKALEAFRLVFR